MGALLPSVTHGVNIIGRYHEISLISMEALFKVMTEELCKIYRYLKFLSDKMQKEYQFHSVCDLECFLKALPEF